MSGLIPRILWPSDVYKEQLAVSGFATDLANALAACGQTTHSDYALVLSDWSNLAVDVSAYVSVRPGFWSNSAQQVEQGEALMLRLQTMRDRVVALGCSAPPDLEQERPAPPPWWGSSLQWGLVAVVAVAGAYGVGKVVEGLEILPLPRRAPSR